MKVKESKRYIGFLFSNRGIYMAKKKKGYQELKKYRTANGYTDELTVDLKKYADEFSKLLKKIYHFILSYDKKFL